MKKILTIIFLILPSCSFIIPKQKEIKNEPIEDNVVVPSTNTDVPNKEQIVLEPAALEPSDVIVDKENETPMSEQPVEPTLQEITLKEVCIKGVVHYYTSQCNLIPKFKEDGSLFKCNSEL